MKIVMTSAGYLTNWGGAQRFVQIISSEFVKEHEVVVYTKRHRGEIVKQFDVPVVNHMPTDGDLYIVDTNEFADLVPKGKFIIFVSHSVSLKQCMPDKNYDACVSVSQEIKNLNLERGIQSEVVHNPVPDSFFEIRSENKKIPRVLAYTRPGSYLAKKLSGYRFEYDLVEQKIDDIARLFNNYDLIITRGRGVLEAMACAKSVVSYDRRRTESEFYGWGYLEPDKFDLYLFDNFSGRTSSKRIDNPLFEIAAYDADDGKKLREKSRIFSAKKVAKRILSLYG
jgi:hypothetical protein